MTIHETDRSPASLPATARFRERLAGSGAGSLGGVTRARRWDMLLACFPTLDRLRVIDLGGTARFWIEAPVKPAHVTTVNLDPACPDLPSWIDVVVADACEVTQRFAGESFDLVFSNSTIEHVGGHYRRQQFADTVMALAPHHWIQTPYRYFPVEPHFVCPGFQFLPLAARRQVAQHWPLSYTRSMGRSLDDPTGAALATELLDRTQLRYYFPESDLLTERLLGLPKSIVATR